MKTKNTKENTIKYKHDHSELFNMLILSIVLIAILVGLNFWLN